jgi:Recombinase
LASFVMAWRSQGSVMSSTAIAATPLLTRSGRPFDKGSVYKLLMNRTYIGLAVHKGKAYPGEQAGIIPQALWDQVHAIIQEAPRARGAKNRSGTPALLRGLLFGPDGRAMSPSHTRKRGRLYRYYVSQVVLQGGANDAPHRRLPAGEIEALVMAQVRALLRQPEVIVGTWREARAEVPDLTEAEVRDALGRLDPLWDELFPGEQERIVRLLVERVTVGEAGAEIRLNLEGLAGLAGTWRRSRGRWRHDQRDGGGAHDHPAPRRAKADHRAGRGAGEDGRRRSGCFCHPRGSRPGEGAGAGLSVAADAGIRAYRHHQRSSRGREDQPVLCFAAPSPYATLAEHRGSHHGWSGAGELEFAGSSGAVSR